jgi:hypothetical protein
MIEILPTEGKLYKVEFGDCCIGGSFVARLLHIHWSADCTGMFYAEELIFDSAILENWLCCKFIELES